MTPSVYQRAIYEDVATGTGHTVVVARAGSGKTTTILEALKHVPAGKSVLLLAFNKEIAGKLVREVPPDVTVRTTHGYGFAAVTSSFGRARVDDRKVDSLLREMLREEQMMRLGPYAPTATDRERERWAATLASRVAAEEKRTRDERQEYAKAARFAKAHLAREPHELRALIAAHGIEVPLLMVDAFVARLGRLLALCAERVDVLDFDDMIWLPVVHDLRLRKFDRVFVDETQDLNLAQIRLVLGACADGGRICAVGDDRQAIYSFRGADRHAIARVTEELGARRLPLSVTYRCDRAIVDVARKVVPDLEAKPGALDGEVIETTMPRMLTDAAPGDFILSRSRAPLVGICRALLRRCIPAAIAGHDIGKELEGRIRKFRAATVEALISSVSDWRIREIDRLSLTDPPGDIDPIDDTAACIVALTDGAATVEEVLERVRAMFADPNDSARVMCSTTHKAKGLERDRAWVLADTYRKRETTEEENLWYVAVTRAKHVLCIVRGAA